MSAHSTRQFGDSGDAQQRFLSLFLRREREIFRCVAVLVPNATDAEDIVQQTALALGEKFDAYDPAQSSTPWACRFALNKARQWLEPICANGLTDSAVQVAVKADYFPNQFTVIPRDGDIVTVGGTNLTWHVFDTKDYNVDLYLFASALGKPTSFVLFWAVTVVNCPEEMPRERLAIGSNAASVWWVDGQEVVGIYGERQTVIDDGVSKRLTLKIGLK